MELNLALRANQGLWFPQYTQARPLELEVQEPPLWRIKMRCRMYGLLAEFTLFDVRNLSPFLLHRDEEMRVLSCEIVERLGVKALPVLPEVRCLLGDSSRHVRRAAFMVYQQLGDISGGVKTIARLLQSSTDGNSFVAAAALRSFRYTLHHAIDELFEVIVSDTSMYQAQTAASDALLTAGMQNVTNCERIIRAGINRILRGKIPGRRFISEEAQVISFLLPLLKLLAKKHPERPILDQCERELALMLMVTRSEGLQQGIVDTMAMLKTRFDK